MSDLRLSKQQRKTIYEGRCPEISGAGQCPVKPGYVLTLSKLMSLEVTSVKHRAGGWKVNYTVYDRRDPVRNLRRTPPALHDDQLRSEPSPEAIKQAAEESAYTSAPTTLSDAGEAVQGDWLKKETKRVRKANEGRRNASELARVRAEAADIRAALTRLRASSSLDVSSDIRVMERRLQAIESKLAGRAA